MINPDLLKTFLSLARNKHFTRAALELNMTQPGVSQHLFRLEAHLGVSLVQRKGKQFRLTHEGRQLVSYATQLLADHQRFRESLGSDEPHVGACRFASPGSFGFKLFDTLMACARRYPRLVVELTVAPNHSMAALLLEEKIDVGFMTQNPAHPTLEARLFEKERLVLVVPRSFSGAISFPRLLALGFVNHPDGFHHAGRLLEKNFPDEFGGMGRVPVRVFINQANRILDPVVLGLGFTVLPSGACDTYRDRKQLRFVKLPKIVEDPIYRVQRKGERLPARYAVVEALLAGNSK